MRSNQIVYSHRGVTELRTPRPQARKRTPQSEDENGFDPLAGFPGCQPKSSLNQELARISGVLFVEPSVDIFRRPDDAVKPLRPSSPTPQFSRTSGIFWSLPIIIPYMTPFESPSDPRLLWEPKKKPPVSACRTLRSGQSAYTPFLSRDPSVGLHDETPDGRRSLKKALLGFFVPAPVGPRTR